MRNAIASIIRARIYLLDGPTATLRVYELPTAALEPLA